MSITRTVIFVHGWSVTNTECYGELPRRLQHEAAGAGITLKVKEIFLSEYISFHDEVRLSDISRAFRTAVADTLPEVLKGGQRFVCITHSTGGPVIRDWWHRYYDSIPRSGICPMSHLIMLAPANHGSALAQLGKGRLGRLKSWLLDGVEPGQGVLDWLELGSAESWNLNASWNRATGNRIGAKGIFPFVLTGQTIDRKFYDVLNPYTGEMGSDGVVRVAAANLNGRLIKLAQQAPIHNADEEPEAPELRVEEVVEAPLSAMRLCEGKSHSGETIGIMRSVKKNAKLDPASTDTVDAILECLNVKTKAQYTALRKRFEKRIREVQKKELVETETGFLHRERLFFHDRYSMVVFRVRDDKGHPVTDYDLVLTAGRDSNPNHLPQGFLRDRQRNHLNRETITYYFNYDAMAGCPEVKNADGKVLREAMPGTESMGLKIIPRPESGFVHYLPCEIQASKDLLLQALQPNCTTLFDIRLRRIVHKNVFRMDQMTETTTPKNFKRTKPGDVIPN
ncbi:phospholipase [Candidatus Bipolaricaulota bacterium]|nr:phospholipase [Candidatus Bipolaricaulota bacterium]